MNVFELAQALVQCARAIPIDDNTFSLLVMLIGVIGGVVLTGYFSQQKAKKVKVERKDSERPRKPE
jgi:hypothetical protein